MLGGLFVAAPRHDGAAQTIVCQRLAVKPDMFAPQRFFWKPGTTAPQRAPDLGAAVER